MRWLASFVLLDLLVVGAAHAEPLLLKRGEPAPVDGVLLPDQDAQALSKRVSDGDLAREDLVLEREKTEALKEAIHAQERALDKAQARDEIRKEIQGELVKSAKESKIMGCAGIGGMIGTALFPPIGSLVGAGVGAVWCWATQ